MGQSATTPLTMKTFILAVCVLASTSGQTFQSFPSGGAQPGAQQPQFVFNPQAQVLAQQQQRPAPQQLRQPANTQALQQQFRQPQVAPQQFRQPQAAPQQFRQPQAAPQQFRKPQAAPQQFRQPAISQARPQQLQPAAPQVAPQQFRQPQAPQPAQQQFRQPAQPQPSRQGQPPAGSAQNDALGNVQIAAVEYVHDPSGDYSGELSRFQLFQLKKKQEAEQSKTN